MQITAPQLIRALGCTSGTANKWAPVLNTAMAEFDIDTAMEIAGFVAQCAHESANFSRLRENMNYSADGLLRTFPKYFAGKSNSFINSYARNPERIGNYVYANRYGNGPESSGDGYRYRGGGLIQLTFKVNYIDIGKRLNLDLVSNPATITIPLVAARAAACYWKTCGLNEIVIKDYNMKDETKIVQGGSLGLDHRNSLFLKLLGALNENV